MSNRVSEIMSTRVVNVSSTEPVAEAARLMREVNVGAIVVEDGGEVCGIVTDRDLVVRAIALGRDPETTPISEVCSPDVVALKPEDTIDRAVQLMKERAVRRLLVREVDGRTVGILSLGDLAIARDAPSALGQISSARPNN